MAMIAHLNSQIYLEQQKTLAHHADLIFIGYINNITFA